MIKYISLCCKIYYLGHFGLTSKSLMQMRAKLDLRPLEWAIPKIHLGPSSGLFHNLVRPLEWIIPKIH